MLTLNDYDQYETVDEMLKEISVGLEIEFSYNGRDYFIWHEGIGKNFICENDKEETVKEYSTPKEMIDSHKIEGELLKDIATKLEVTFH